MAAGAMRQELDAGLIATTVTSQPKSVPVRNSPEAKSRTVTTDHMLTAQWSEDKGWSCLSIAAADSLTLSPLTSVFHYGTSCFEGMKVYRGFDGKLRLYRPLDHTERMIQSATRISLPPIPAETLARCIETFVAIEAKRWLPASEPGRFLYIRPILMGSSARLGPKYPDQAMLYIVAVMFPEPELVPSLDDPHGIRQKGLQLITSDPLQAVRAWPGGFGGAKLGASYGPCFAAEREAQEQGFDQLLWLFPPQGQRSSSTYDDAIVTEVGSANFFVLWRDAATGKLQLVTPSTDTGLILRGVTRRSVIQLVDREPQAIREALGGQEVAVQEIELSIGELEQAARDGRILEAFTTGTGSFIQEVSSITIGKRKFSFPVADGIPARFTHFIAKYLQDIMYGVRDHAWGHVVDEENIAVYKQ